MQASSALDILLVDDDKPLRDMLTRSFEREGHRVTAVPDGETALDAAQERSFDVVLLDVALGAGPTGYDVARMLRTRRDVVPIIMLTALDSEADAVQGLEAGADDYVTKPFGLAELRSRIRAVLRRAQGRVVEGNLRVGPVMLDRDLRRVTMEDNPVRLTFSEFELLGCLMSRPGYAFNRQELLRAIWGDSAYRDPRAIDVHIRHLREKLEPRPEEPSLILTVPGPGLPLPGGMIRAALRGLRGRLLLSFVATSAVTLAVAAAITLGPLQSRLRDEARACCRTRPRRCAATSRRRSPRPPKRERRASSDKEPGSYAEQARARARSNAADRARRSGLRAARADQRRARARHRPQPHRPRGRLAGVPVRHRLPERAGRERAAAGDPGVAREASPRRRSSTTS